MFGKTKIIGKSVILYDKECVFSYFCSTSEFGCILNFFIKQCWKEIQVNKQKKK